MINIITIDRLTSDNVSIKTQQYMTMNGTEYAIGHPNRCSYVNSERGRAEISMALEEPYLSAVMAVWGSAPTVSDINE